MRTLIGEGADLDRDLLGGAAVIGRVRGSTEKSPYPTSPSLT